jgi:hypothetical protein
MGIFMGIVSFEDLKTKNFSTWKWRKGRMSPRKKFEDGDKILSSALWAIKPRYGTRYNTEIFLQFQI